MRVRGSPGCSASLHSSPGTQERVNTSVSAFSFSNLVARQNVGIYGLRLGPSLQGWLEEPALSGRLPFGSEILQHLPILHCFSYRRAQTASAPPFPRDTITFCVISAGDSSTKLSHPRSPHPAPAKLPPHGAKGPGCRAGSTSSPGCAGVIMGPPIISGRVAPRVPLAWVHAQREDTSK